VDFWVGVHLSCKGMLTSRRSISPFGSFGESGLTRIEILVLVVVLVVLVAVGFGPVSEYLDKSNVNHAAEKARTLSTLLSQYATDNNDVYPVGEGTPNVGKSEGIARNLLENHYAPDASVFAVGSTRTYRGTATDFSDLAATDISWDFTGGATASTGLMSTAPDLLPVVYTTGETVTYPTAAGAGLDLRLSRNGPFKSRGVVVAYKNNSAVFIPGMPSGSNLECKGFISTEFKDTATYTQIKP
jgi:type II secretory pathway pseudopilin PulG